MNLAESVKHVLINKSQSIFTNFWKEDLKVLLKEILEDVWSMAQSGGAAVKSIKSSGLKLSFKEITESTIDTFKILKILPKRIREGFRFFKEDFIKELDSLTDSKEKTVFCLKVLGVLSSSLVKNFYGMKKSQANLKVKGFNAKNAFTKFLVAEIIFKISQVLVLRVLDEVENELTTNDDIKNIRFFKSVLSDSKKIDPDHEIYQPDLEEGDSALLLVDNLKKYITTGVRS